MIDEEDKSTDVEEPWEALWIQGEQAIQEGAWLKAEFLFTRIAAQEGVEQAHCELGLIREHLAEDGGGDYSSAVAAYRKAIYLTDDPHAHVALGRIFIDESKGFFNPKAALSHFNSDACIDQAGALYGLGMMYEDGIGVCQNLSKSLCRYNEAINAGHVGAKLAKGRVLLKQGVVLKGLYFRILGSMAIAKHLMSGGSDRKLVIA